MGRNSSKRNIRRSAMLITWVKQCCHPIWHKEARQRAITAKKITPTSVTAKTLSASSFPVMTRLLKALKVSVGSLKSFNFYLHLILTAGPLKKAHVIHSPEPPSPAAIQPQQLAFPTAIQREQAASD